MNAPKYGYHTLKVLLARSLYNAHTCPMQNIHTIYIPTYRCKPSIRDRVHRNENFVEIIPVFSTFFNCFKKKIIKAILCNFSIRLLKYF